MQYAIIQSRMVKSEAKIAKKNTRKDYNVAVQHLKMLHPTTFIIIIASNLF